METDRVINRLKRRCGPNFETIHNACLEKNNNNASTLCAKYCQDLSKFDPSVLAKVREYLEMASDELTPPLGLLSYGCSHPELGMIAKPEKCWSKIISDRGICYTTNKGNMQIFYTCNASVRTLKYLQA